MNHPIYYMMSGHSKTEQIFIPEYQVVLPQTSLKSSDFFFSFWCFKYYLHIFLWLGAKMDFVGLGFLFGRFQIRQSSLAKIQTESVSKFFRKNLSVFGKIFTVIHINSAQLYLCLYVHLNIRPSRNL